LLLALNLFSESHFLLTWSHLLNTESDMMYSRYQSLYLTIKHYLYEGQTYPYLSTFMTLSLRSSMEEKKF
jgi:hypothetical protein